jgi:rubrerythrin
VSGAILKGEKMINPIPERRPPEGRQRVEKQAITIDKLSQLKYPIWRCKVCGYLCARETPPEICPICKADKAKFEIIIHSM